MSEQQPEWMTMAPVFETRIFVGNDAAAATQALYDAMKRGDFLVSRLPDGAWLMWMTHVPQPTHYELHVTAFHPG